MKTGLAVRSLALSTVVLATLLFVGCPKTPPRRSGQNPAVPREGSPAPGDVARGKQIFELKCVACHVFGKEMIGPDLVGVTERREKDWLVRWLKDPMGMLQTDPIAKELLAKYKNVPMPPQALSDQDVEDLLAYMPTESGEGAR